MDYNRHYFEIAMNASSPHSTRIALSSELRFLKHDISRCPFRSTCLLPLMFHTIPIHPHTWSRGRAWISTTSVLVRRSLERLDPLWIGVASGRHGPQGKNWAWGQIKTTANRVGGALTWQAPCASTVCRLRLYATESRRWCWPSACCALSVIWEIVKSESIYFKRIKVDKRMSRDLHFHTLSLWLISRPKHATAELWSRPWAACMSWRVEIEWVAELYRVIIINL